MRPDRSAPSALQQLRTVSRRRCLASTRAGTLVRAILSGHTRPSYDLQQIHRDRICRRTCCRRAPSQINCVRQRRIDMNAVSCQRCNSPATVLRIIGRQPLRRTDDAVLAATGARAVQQHPDRPANPMHATRNLTFVFTVTLSWRSRQKVARSPTLTALASRLCPRSAHRRFELLQPRLLHATLPSTGCCRSPSRVIPSIHFQRPVRHGNLPRVQRQRDGSLRGFTCGNHSVAVINHSGKESRRQQEPR